MGLTPEQLREIERPDVTVLVNGVLEGTYVVLLPSPGGARMFASQDVHPGHIAVTFRRIADLIEAQGNGPCGCGQC